MSKPFGFTGIQAAIFDMDGLLVDSEPFWKIAEKEVFGMLGLELNDALLRQVMGFRLSEVVEHWFHYQPWPNPDHVKTEELIVGRMMELLGEHAAPLDGVYEAIAFCKSKQWKLAVASASDMRLIKVVLEKLSLTDSFDVLWSAQYEPYGKPHPGIFITTAAKLNVLPVACVVFEDSVNGVLAAKAARMKCIAVPEHATYDDARFAIADHKIRSLKAIL